MIYSYLDIRSTIKATNIKELDADCTYLPSGQSIPSDATMIIVHGVLRGMGDRIKEAIERQIPWVYMDNGYHGKYKRVILNATAPTTMREGKRFDYEVNLESWKGGEGDHILVVPPSYPYMDTFGASDFLNYVCHNINRYTGRDLIVRAKPAKPERKKWAQPLESQLENAYAVVTWGSAVALDALRMGIPTISLGWCPAKAASFGFEDLETDRLWIEPARTRVWDNLTWSSFERNELPLALQTAMENARKNDF